MSIKLFVAAPARPLLATPKHRVIRKTSNRLPQPVVPTPRLTRQEPHQDMRAHLVAILKLRQAHYADLPAGERVTMLVDRFPYLTLALKQGEEIVS